MKIENKNRKKYIIIATCIVALIAASGTAFAIYSSQSTNTSEKTTPKKSESDDKQADSIQKDPEVKETRPNTDQPEKPQDNPSTNKNTVSLVASADIVGSSLYIRGGINTPVGTNGTCFALLSGPNGESLNKPTDLLQNPGTTDCRTIAIPISELSSGRWKFTLNYDSPDTEGVSNENTFDIK